MTHPSRWLSSITWTLVPLALLAVPRVEGADPQPPKGPRDVTRQFVVPDGMQVTVWAQAPLVHNPTSIDIDARGRVWVTEAINYRNFRLKDPNQYDGLRRPGGDRVVILEDTDGDGAADSSRVFVEDRDLVAPLGIAVLGQQVLVSCSPSLFLWTDEDEDGKPNRKEVFLTGFGGLDHDHGLHSLVGGPDGRWYFNAGNAGPHVVKDRSGWTLRAGSSYTGGSPHNSRSLPGLKSDDGRIWVGGVALRINPDGTGLTPIGHNFRNAYELCVDSFGNVWQNDNDDTISCRTTWLMEGGNLGFGSVDGARTWQADKRPWQSIPAAHWRQDDPGVIPAGDVYGPGAPTGIVLNEGDGLGTAYRGMLLSCEAGRNVVWGYLPRADGAGFKLERFPFFASVPQDDPNYVWHKLEIDTRKWFRPSDVAIGPDGAVYVADWHDQVVGGHQMNDKKGVGTIYRIAPRNARLPVPRIDLATLPGQIAALKGSAVNVRYLAFAALRARGASALPAVQELVKDPNPFVRARSIWLAAQLGPAGIAWVEQRLRDDDSNLRITALRALRQTRASILTLAASLAKDPSPAVRRELALALRDLPLDQCRDALLQLAAGYDGKDRWYLEALGTACEGKEEAIYPALQQRLGSDPTQWSQAYAGIVWRLRPPAAIPALAQRARSGAVSAAGRRQAVDALAFMKSPEAARATLQLALDGPEDLRPYASWWVRHRDGNDWQTLGLARLLGPDPAVSVKTSPAFRPPAEPVFASPIIRRGSIDIDVDIDGAQRLWLVVHDAGNGISCDWGDWIEPMLIGPQQTVKLTDLKWLHGDTGYGQLHLNRNCKGLPLRVGGQPVAFGIGTHANSTLVYDLKGKGFTRFRARAGVDNGSPQLGGSDYPDSPASARFLVYHDGPSPRARASVQSQQLLDPALDFAKKRDIIIEMSQSGVGGHALLALAARGKLPDPLKSVAAERVFGNPDLSVRALASEYFRRPGAVGPALPPITRIAALAGDRQRGRDVFFSERTGCARCHTVAGEGGDVGPDLTQIGLKYDRVALLDSILNPSASILVGYEAWLLATEKGETFTGFILADGDPVILRDTEGKQRSLPRKDIAERHRLKQSLMPDNVAVGLKAEELADLLAFLLSPPAVTKPPR